MRHSARKMPSLTVDLFSHLDRHDVWRTIDLLVREHPRGGGVYRVHALREGAPREWAPDSPLPVSRAVAPDGLGRLYVGASLALTGCLFDLWKSFNLPEVVPSPHRAGRAYHAAPALQRRFPRLGVTVRFAEDPLAEAAEELRLYVAEFGEPPPLDAAAPQAPERLAAPPALRIAAVA